MWLTSWWVAWLLNFYGFSHTNCMVFYRTPWTHYGIPWNSIGTSGNPMAFHGIPWTSKETPWNFMAFHGTPSILHGTPLNSVAFHGTPWILHGTPWILHGILWNSLQVIPSISMEFHGFPWNSMEVFHTGNELISSYPKHYNISKWSSLKRILSHKWK